MYDKIPKIDKEKEKEKWKEYWDPNKFIFYLLDNK